MLKKLETEENFFNLLKDTYEKSTAKIILNDEGFPPNNRRRMSVLTTSIECCTVGSSQCSVVKK